jgi:ATP phosphoribosyltransferase regulatory subunit
MARDDFALIEGVFNPLPKGARDLLPATCRLRRAVTNRLLDRFELWGFEQVMPPAIEYFDVLARGLGREERDRTVRFIEAGSGELVGLRSDVTPQIARMVAQRVGGSVAADEIVRLCYAADVVRTSQGDRGRSEVHQVGVEYVGDDEPAADAELIALCNEALRSLGLSGHRFDLSHHAIVRSALASLKLPEPACAEIRGRLARKDATGLDRVLHRWKVAKRKRAAIVALSELSGSAKILTRARRELEAIGVAASIDRLETVVDALDIDDADAASRVTLDLGEVRGYDYYTGLRMRVWAPGVSVPLVRGGRYDDMLARYGADLPATGFAVDLDALEEALHHAEVEVDGAEVTTARLLAYDGSQACARELRGAAVGDARRARARGTRAWVDGRLTLEGARSYADARGILRISYYSSAKGKSGRIQRTRWRRASGGWKPDDRKR